MHLLRRFFECGHVGRNDRHDNHREPLYRFAVRRLTDLSGCIVPFFEANPLVTAKNADFIKFAVIVRMMEKGDHLRWMA